MKNADHASAYDKQIQEMTAKRSVLSQVAGVFDPIGFVAPFLIRAKIGIQRLWQRGLDWDQELSNTSNEFCHR